MDLDLVADGEVDPAAARDLLAGILEASTETSVVAADLDGNIVVTDPGPGIPADQIDRLPGGAAR
jgi:signal transduction histidine kinase